MELKISCDATVKLKKITSLRTVDCNVIDYELLKDTLNGNIQIDGTFIKDEMDKTYDFKEIVPFTVVFRDSNVKIEDIVCSNFSCQEIVNQGIECHFDVFITYDGLEKEEVVEEIPVVVDETVVPVQNEIKEEPTEKVEEPTEEVEANVPEVTHDDITTEYDSMLGEILEVRNDNFLEVEGARAEEEKPVEPEKTVTETQEVKKVNVATNDRTEKVGLFSRMKENYDVVSVFYVDSEEEVERVCKEEQIPISEAYQDFAKNRRIIVK